MESDNSPLTKGKSVKQLEARKRELERLYDSMESNYEKERDASWDGDEGERRPYFNELPENSEASREQNRIVHEIHIITRELSHRAANAKARQENDYARALREYEGR